jgi:uncharacterized phage protein (TIGR01671 family)
MNQIKFRALNEETKVFVYGDLIKSQMFGSEGEKPSSSFINETPLDVEDISTCLSGGKYLFKTTFVKVIDETVGQFTGLQDKNGVDIYEGHLLLVVNKTRGYAEEEGTIKLVQLTKYLDNEQYTDDMHMGWNLGGLLLVDCIEDGSTVIGNIHENPELIK